MTLRSIKMFLVLMPGREAATKSEFNVYMCLSAGHTEKTHSTSHVSEMSGSELMEVADEEDNLHCDPHIHASD